MWFFENVQPIPSYMTYTLYPWSSTTCWFDMFEKPIQQIQKR